MMETDAMSEMSVDLNHLTPLFQPRMISLDPDDGNGCSL
jgi:hypothetical protein